LTLVAGAFGPDGPSGFTERALHSAMGYRFYFRVADTPVQDPGVNSAVGPAAMRASSLKFQVAADRWNMITNHFGPPCRVFLLHIGKEAIFLSPKTTQFGTITQVEFQNYRWLWMQFEGNWA
jgi:hypothetical protein